jgi:crotonobetainyl-CoA:carnitine CoA-transferase CaiB-like acyl-CoA transferase
VNGSVGALHGLKVIELGQLISGPFCARMLGEFGAEVIKVELPPTGDTMRYVPPDGYYWENLCLGFMTENHNKHHVGIDLHVEEGKELFRHLVQRADVVVENLRAGTLDRWDLGYRQLSRLNPRLVYLAANGFGQWGPYTVGRASYDLLAQAMSGLAAITGFAGRPPMKSGTYIGDFFGSLLNAVSILAALHWRERTGKGQFIEFAQSEGLIRALDWTWVFHHLTGGRRERYGNRDVALGVSDVFHCQDGFVAISAPTDEEFAGLAAAMGRPELAQDPRFGTLSARLQDENARSLLDLVAEWALGRGRDEIDELGARHGFAAAPVLSARDHFDHPHLRERRAVWQLDDPLYGDLVEYGPAPKLSETPGRIKWPARPVGFHNRYVFSSLLGLTAPEVRDLEERGVIGRWAERPGAAPPPSWKPGEGEVLPEQAG